MHKEQLFLQLHSDSAIQATMYVPKCLESFTALPNCFLDLHCSTDNHVADVAYWHLLFHRIWLM